jgi:DNA-binding response OmpR family regulator
MTKVLLVEDDPSISRLYFKALTFEHYEVQTAENGVKALEVLKNYGPDAILLDIMMPEMNGIDLLKKLKSDVNTEEIPIIVLTNVADSDVTLEAVECGAALILIKSQIEPDQVIEAIQKVVAGDILQSETLNSDGTTVL